MIIRIPEDFMTRARFKKGDKIDIGFTEDNQYWRLKVVSADAPGYMISTPSNNPRRGQLRLTWYHGMPLLGDDESVLKARGAADENTMRISPTEIIFKLGDIYIEERSEELPLFPYTPHR